MLSTPGWTQRWAPGRGEAWLRGRSPVNPQTAFIIRHHFQSASTIFGLAFGLHVLGRASSFFAETGGKRRSWTAGTPSAAMKLGENRPPDQMLIPVTTDVPTCVFPSNVSIHLCS